MADCDKGKISRLVMINQKKLIMLKAKLNDRKFRFKGADYFTAKAENMELGIYGKKRASLVNPSYVHAERRLKLQNASVERVEPIKIDLEASDKVKAEINSKLKAVDGNVDFNLDKISTAELIVIKLHILSGPLMDEFNKNTTALGHLKNMRNARIVNQVFVVVTAETARKMTASVELTAKSIAGNAVEVSGKYDGNHTSKIKLSKGTVLAYGILKPLWNKKKTKLVSMRVDQHGLG